jgi:hypothetical protein
MSNIKDNNLIKKRLLVNPKKVDYNDFCTYKQNKSSTSSIENEMLNLKLNEKLLLTDPLQSDNMEKLCTHQKKVICYCRDEDDREKKIEIDLYTGEVKINMIDLNDKSNPSSRRQGVIIEIHPEGTNNIFNLNISQHKGSTYIETSINNNKP